jgi:uncharacterized membrane protein
VAVFVVNNPNGEVRVRVLDRPTRIVVMLAVFTALAGCAPRSDPGVRGDSSVPMDGAPGPATSSVAPGNDSAAAGAPFRARGNEPGWSLEIGAKEMTLLADYGELRLVGPAPAPASSGDTTRYAAEPQGHVIEITVVRRTCHDGMSGFPYPSIVTVRLDGRELHGCGGERLDADSGAGPPAR